MSRNLCRTDCRSCPGEHEHILLEEAPRPITREDVSWCFDEYAGMLVAKARCVLCGALYLAWVDWPSNGRGHFRLADHPGARFCDLSYRHAFNDEPAIEDTPIYEVERVVTYRRRPAAVEESSYRQVSTDPKWREHDERALERWKRRQRAAVESGLTYLDELAARRESEEARRG